MKFLRTAGIIIAQASLVLMLSTRPIMAELASPEEMEQVCQNWLTEVVYERGSWAGEDAPEVVGTNEIRSDGILLARYYDIKPSGFVVVPVLKAMMPIKAYSDESILNQDQEGGFLLLLQEVLRDRMQLYADQYGSLDAPQPPGGEAVFGRGQRELWDTYTVPSQQFRDNLASLRRQPLDEAGPLLISSWHQRIPYNNECPDGDGGRCVVGCVATATAQILDYWQWPPSGFGDHSFTWAGDNSCGGNTPPQELYADFSNEYDWAHIVDSCDGGCSPEDSAALAELNHEVGVAFHMDYGACGSGASVSRALVVYSTFFKYSLDVQKANRADYDLAGWFGLIQEEINNGRPIQYRINMHSIVCDGWRDDGSQYEFHMNYGWGNEFSTWYVLDSLYCGWVAGDICPADEEFMITHIEPQTEPVMGLIGQTLDDTQGDGDGHADVGETVELSTSIINRGWDAENVVGELSTSDPQVTVITSTAVFDASVPWGGESVSQTPFAFTVDPACPDPYVTIFELEISASGGYAVVDTLYLFIGDTPGFADDLESGQGAWTHGPVTPTYLDQWHLSDFRSHSGSTSWKAGGAGGADYADILDGGLVTQPFLLPFNARLRFWHWIDAETDSEEGMAWDGAVVMISSGDGNWTQIHPTDGYPYAVVDNAASPFEGGTPCLSGSYDWSELEFDLSEYSGVVQIMFRLGTDGAATEEGWYIDDLEVTTGGCCIGLRGNVDCDSDDLTDLSDLTRLIDYLFLSFEPLCCLEEANVNDPSGGLIDLGDLTRLIDYLFISFTPLAECQ